MREIKFTSDKFNKISIFFLSYIVCRKPHRELLKRSYKNAKNSTKSINKMEGTSLLFKSNSSISYNNKLDSFKSIAHNSGLIQKNNHVNDSIWIPLAEKEEDFEENSVKKLNKALNFHLKKFSSTNNSSNGSNYEIKSNCYRKSREKENKNKIFCKKIHMNDQNVNDVKYLTQDKINSDVYDIINRTVFIIFLLFILNLNIFLLVIFPYFVKSTPSVMNTP